MKKAGDLRKKKRKACVKCISAVALAAAVVGSSIELYPLMAAEKQREAGQGSADVLTAGSMVHLGKELVDDADGLDNKGLFEGYLHQMFYESGHAPYSFDHGVSGLSQLDQEEQELYTQLKAAITEVAEGKRTSSKITVDAAFSGTYQTSADEEMDKAAAEEAIGRHLSEEVDHLKVVTALLADCPYELYWFAKSDGYYCGYSYTKNNGTYFVDQLNFVFCVSRDYAVKNGGSYDPYQVDGTQVLRAQAAKEKADAIVRKYASEDDHNKLRGYLTEICDLCGYDDAAASAMTDADDPWQLIAVFDGDPNTNVVCEGYAKAFAYLFEKSYFTEDLKCYIVTGGSILGNGVQAAGGHMWNVVTMEDGKNYMVDVTNCDEGTIGAPDQLFLAGMTGSVESGYTFQRDGSRVTFAYDDATRSLYPSSVLRLSEEAYTYDPVPKKDQDPLAVNVSDKTYGDGAFVLSVEGGSGTGAVRYQVPAGNGVISIDGDRAEIIGAGTVTVTAVKASDSEYKRAMASADITVAKKTLAPVLSGSVSKKHDGTISVANAVSNTLEIVLEGILDMDRGNVSVAADFYYADAAVGVNKSVRAVNIVLSGVAAQNYTLSRTTAAADVGVIEQAGDSAPSGTMPDDNAPVNTPADGSAAGTATDTITNADGSTTVTLTTTDGTGRVIRYIETVTETDGSVTKIVNEIVVDPEGNETAVTTTIKTDPSGTVVDATAVLDHTVASGDKAVLTGKAVSKIIEAAGQEAVMITMAVNDALGNRKYEVQADARDLVAGNSLCIYRLDPSSGGYIMVDPKTYKVSQDGDLSVSMKENGTYQFVDQSKAAAIDRAILDSVAVQKSAIKIKKGKSKTVSLSSGLDMDNVKKISYTSSKKSVAAVTKKGKVKAKKAGRATIRINVTLKNGSKKTVSVKVTVK